MKLVEGRVTKLWAAIWVICFPLVMTVIQIFAKYASTNSFPRNVSVVLWRSYRAGARQESGKCLRCDHFSFHSGFGALNTESRWLACYWVGSLGVRSWYVWVLQTGSKWLVKWKMAVIVLKKRWPMAFARCRSLYASTAFWHTPLNGVSSLPPPRGQSSALKEAKAVITVLQYHWTALGALNWWTVSAPVQGRSDPIKRRCND